MGRMVTYTQVCVDCQMADLFCARGQEKLHANRFVFIFARILVLCYCLVDFLALCAHGIAASVGSKT
eukprot:GDKH01022184.1.p2 GENE.GDKH01022184.1~~GDKH01022184.1.p2  ORF type:complete len:67 (-),score=0.51 GDKH01022184.1:31-231(-)